MLSENKRIENNYFLFKKKKKTSKLMLIIVRNRSSHRRFMQIFSDLNAKKKTTEAVETMLIALGS